MCCFANKMAFPKHWLRVSKQWREIDMNLNIPDQRPIPSFVCSHSSENDSLDGSIYWVLLVCL